MLPLLLLLMLLLVLPGRMATWMICSVWGLHVCRLHLGVTAVDAAVNQISGATPHYSQL
jgi:hypothetical protein